MLVMGYFCVAQIRSGGRTARFSYGAPGSTYHIPFTDAYLDYLSRPGGRHPADRPRRYMIDWVWNPSEKARGAAWIDAEKKLFTS